MLIIPKKAPNVRLWPISKTAFRICSGNIRHQLKMYVNCMFVLHHASVWEFWRKVGASTRSDRRLRMTMRVRTSVYSRYSSGEKARCHIIKTAAPSCSPQHNRHVIKTYQNLDIARTCTLSRQPQLWFGISPWFVLVSVSWLQLVTSKIPAWPGGSIAQSCSELRSGVQTLFWKDGDLERPWPNGTNGSTHLFLVSTLYN